MRFITKESSPLPLPSLRSQFQLPICNFLQILYLYYDRVSFLMQFIIFSELLPCFFIYLIFHVYITYSPQIYQQKWKSYFYIFKLFGHPNNILFFNEILFHYSSIFGHLACFTNSLV